MEPDKDTDPGGESIPPRYVLPSVVAEAFGPLFLDAGFCARFFINNVHGPDPLCPACKELLIDERQVARYYALKKFTCKNCQRLVSAKKGTVLENCSMTAAQYMLLSLFLEAGFSNAEVGRIAGMTSENVRIWKRKLNV